MTDLRSADQLAPEELAQIGFADPLRAKRLLVALAGRGVTDDDVAELLPSLLSALADCPDPDRALANFVRWSDALVNRPTHFRYLAGHPAGVRILIHIGATSQYLSDILARNPEYAEILVNPSVRRGAKPPDEMNRELAALLGCIAQVELKLDAMRRFRQREVLRIASRDLLGLADMPTTAQEFSSLADVCIQHCYELARSQVHESGEPASVPRMAVIALGKLGGAELNYSSDIDVVFVCEDTDETETIAAAIRLAELLIKYLARETRSGHLFRVDTRLRPEGRFGPLVRTLRSYASYFENWAETWERQAMLKARYVAGDPGVGQRFLELLGPLVYPRVLSPSMLNEIRQNKLRLERTQLGRADPSRNVKIGIGGIRDVEFTVQLLQMRYGAADPLVRTPNTLEAIARLRQGAYLDEADAETLRQGYIFLRTVEHRLQLLYDRQTQDLPESRRELELLAKRLGYKDAGAFLDEYRATTEGVRRVHERIFHTRETTSRPSPVPRNEALRELALELATLPDNPSDALAAVQNTLGTLGFRDTQQALRLLKTAVSGTSHGREAPDAVAAFQSLLPDLLQQCARSPDPDNALHGMFLLAEASPNRAQWYRALNEAPALLQRLVRLAAGSRTLMHLVARHPEWLDLLVSDEIIAPDTKPREAFHEELEVRLAVAEAAGEGACIAALALYAGRERLRIGARDIWGETSAASICAELTHLADALLGALLKLAAKRAAQSTGWSVQTLLDHLAIIGLGKLGGAELSFYSDLDVLFVCSDEAHGKEELRDVLPLARALALVAEHVLALSRELRQHDLPFSVDVRLRPEGRFGPLVLTVSQFAHYFKDRAETWERQSLIKARHVAGSPEVAAAFLGTVVEFVYGQPLSESDAAEILAMKRRIETERVAPSEHLTNVKLGRGGMSDIEFVTQLWQLHAGMTVPSVRIQRTTDALDALGTAGVLPSADAGRLASNYRFLLRLRSRMALLAGQPVDALPSDAGRVRALALGFGMTDSGTTRAEDAFRKVVRDRMDETRRIFERLFRVPGKRERSR